MSIITAFLNASTRKAESPLAHIDPRDAVPITEDLEKRLRAATQHTIIDRDNDIITGDVGP